MTEDGIPLLERVANYYSKLSSVAADLNAVSDELGKSISDIDIALKKLNLGITTWVPIRSGEGNHHEGDFTFWSRDVGYSKVGGKWGISLRTFNGDFTNPDEEVVEQWPFNEAPRALRLEAIDKIPTLLETLSNDAVKTTKDIRAKLSEAQAVAEAVKRAANRPEQAPLQTTTRNVTPKIDLSHIAKPGDVLRAIQDKRKIEQRTTPDTTNVPVPSSINIDSVRSAVCSALVSNGHATAAELLSSASWIFDRESVHIDVPGVGKKLLSLTINVEAEKIIRQELQRLGAPTRFLVAPSLTVAQIIKSAEVK